ncbi:MAG TPA: glycoside hydrolase family 31 protein [bacterium]|nr:glycoside hydrolase family 31 protein [bacterium]
MKNRWVLFAILVLFCSMMFVACGDDDDDDDNDSGDDTVDDDTTDDDAGDDDDTGVGDDDDDDDDDDDFVVPPVENPEPLWPEWVLRHWVWEDESTQSSATQYVDDYLAHDIPVGAVIIDSPWETGYNTFEWDESLFADPQGMIDYFHSLDVRVFMWITPNVNVDSPNYQEGFDNGYYINDGRTLEWWKGEGSFIDYNNPDAMTWWHGLMDNVLDMEIDGWKTDGSEFGLYIFSPIVHTYSGNITPKEYQEQYYRDFFNYTRERLGNDRVITARPVDSYGVPFWGPTFAPRDVNFAAWVGDQDPTWFGMNAALINLFFSGDRGAVNIGCDIGGYRSDDMRDKNVFIRWAQLGALLPIMENGGGGEHRPWMYDTETEDIYRKFVLFHEQLLPYLYSQGAEYYDDGLSLLRPIDKWTWHYNLGDDLLVAAMVNPGTVKTVKFPEGATWINYWTGEEYAGGTEEKLDFPFDQYPVFVRKGAIVPMDNSLHETVFPVKADERAPIIAVIYPAAGEKSFNVYEEGGTGANISYTLQEEMTIRLSATERQYAFRLMNVDTPTKVSAEPYGVLAAAAGLQALEEAESGWYYDPAARELWIKPGAADRGLMVTVE